MAQVALPGVLLAEEPEFTQALFVGHPGSGKTTALCHMAHLGPILVVNAEGGLKKQRLAALGVPIDNIRVAKAETPDELLNLGESLRVALLDNPTALVGIGWDSVTELALRFVAHYRGEDWAKYKRKLEQEQADPEHGRFFTDRSVYGDVAGALREALLVFRDLPCHFVVTALPDRRENEDGTVEILPAATPAVVKDLMGKVDLIGWFDSVGTDENGNEVIKGTFRGGGAKKVKDRMGILPTPMWYPTFDRIQDYVDGRLIAADDPVQDANTGAEEALAATTGAPKRRRRTEAAAAAESE